jgi:uncharacterized protein with HEPN domain
MSHHEPMVRLRHMLSYAREAVAMIQGRVRADLESDRQLNLALVRLLEIVGEAAARVPAEEREKNSQIPWLDIISLRNRLIHGYDTVDFDILWQIVQQDLPSLIQELESIVGGNESA